MMGTTPCQNHLFIEDESQNFDEMRSVAEFEPRAGSISQFLQLFSPILKNGSFCKAVVPIIAYLFHDKLDWPGPDGLWQGGEANPAQEAGGVALVVEVYHRAPRR